MNIKPREFKLRKVVPKLKLNKVRERNPSNLRHQTEQQISTTARSPRKAAQPTKTLEGESRACKDTESKGTLQNLEADYGLLEEKLWQTQRDAFMRAQEQKLHESQTRRTAE